MRQRPLDSDPDTYTGAVLAARIYSNVASPPALFSAFAFLMAWVDLPNFSGLLRAALYGFLASLLPVLYIVYLYKKGHVQDLHVSSTEERRIPYLVGLAGAVLAFVIVLVLGGTPRLGNLILTHLVLMLVLTAANAVWLISAHAATVTVLTLLTGSVFGWAVGLAFAPLIPITFYVRRFLKRHTYGELISGLLAGAGIFFILAALGAYA